MKVARIRPPRSAVAGVPNIAGPLVRWFARVGRDLPWRRSRDPYRVWLSEIMLQQTQVERVKDYFTRFLATFPDVHALAAAREDRVLRLWEGLGYYRRARQLHAAARRIVADHGGAFPRTVTALRSLPGIGRYTAGAIASIAFDAPEPIVEANSRRVLARLAGYDRPLDGPRGDEAIWEIATSVVPRREPGRFNQALMDLGALVCTPSRPLCTTCPLAALCVAHRTGRVGRIPVKSARRATQRLRETAVVRRHGDRVLVERRTPGEWWEGLWDFPREGAAAKGRRLGMVRYTVTHHAIECVVRQRAVARRSRSSADRRWVTVADLAKLAMTSPGRRIAALLKPG
ncbi:MAG: A/G-specific adenine glycosylase [Planctomycetia bacterium]